MSTTIGKRDIHALTFLYYTARLHFEEWLYHSPQCIVILQKLTYWRGPFQYVYQEAKLLIYPTLQTSCMRIKALFARSSIAPDSCPRHREFKRLRDSSLQMTPEFLEAKRWHTNRQKGRSHVKPTDGREAAGLLAPNIQRPDLATPLDNVSWHQLHFRLQSELSGRSIAQKTTSRWLKSKGCHGLALVKIAPGVSFTWHPTSIS